MFSSTSSDHKTVISHYCHTKSFDSCRQFLYHTLHTSAITLWWLYLHLRNLRKTRRPSVVLTCCTSRSRQHCFLYDVIVAVIFACSLASYSYHFEFWCCLHHQQIPLDFITVLKIHPSCISPSLTCSKDIINYIFFTLTTLCVICLDVTHPVVDISCRPCDMSTSLYHGKHPHTLVNISAYLLLFCLSFILCLAFVLFSSCSS